MDKKISNKKLPVFLLTITNEEQDSEVNKVSFVAEPAIEINWFAFDSEGAPKKFEFKTQDKQKRNVIGPLMVPNLPVYRKAKENMPECYVMMNSDTIEVAEQKFMKRQYNNQINANHSDNVDGAYVIESWIIEDPAIDKSAKYGYSLPKGTWMGVIHCEDEQFWGDYIQTGELKGFSVEGAFNYGPQVGNKELNMESKFSSEDPISLDELADYIVELSKK